MKTFRLAAAASILLAGTLSARSLYYMGEDAQESSPLKWAVGVNLIWDDNVNPTVPAGVPGFEDDVLSINPYVQANFINITPQTTVDLYARLGAIYYFDEPAAFGSDDVYPDAKLGFNLTHRFSERLRWVSRNFVSYQLEPDYDYGFASSRLADAYLYWSTDQALGFRWTERFATYTGVRFSGLDYDSLVLNQDRTYWEIYNQFRFQATPQTVLTFDYRYQQVDAGGLASDSTNQYLLAGIEHRVSPTTILVFRGGAQLREVDTLGGDDSTSPFAELMIRSRINDQFNVRAYVRYSVEDWDTVLGGIEFDNTTTIRAGVSADYALSPMVNIFGGIAYIGRDYDDGRVLGTPIPVPGANISEDMVNAYIGVSVKVTDWLYAQASYNYTNASSDVVARDYDRNRISIGMRAEF
jgi:hypothetical protein